MKQRRLRSPFLLCSECPKVAFLSGCKPHPLTVPAETHRIGHGEVAAWRVKLVTYSFKFDFIDSVRPAEKNRCLATNCIEQLLVNNEPSK
jgi:hypothetical protein